MAVGDPVSEERVAELFERDIAWTIADCQRLIPNFDELPEQCRLILANMMFNLGMNRMGKFVKLLAAIEAGNYNKAADEMHDSRWRWQVPERAGRLIARMREVGNPG